MEQNVSSYLTRTLHRGHYVKVKFKDLDKPFSSVRWYLFIVLVVVIFGVDEAKCNRPPRFLIDGQTEIVLRLKEGAETPVGSLIYRLRGSDPDDDPLQFGLRSQQGNDIIRIESSSPTEADVYLNQELDRETKDEYAIVLTLTDGHLGYGNFITQSLLLLVEDVNDNTPVFRNYQPTVSVREDADPGVVATLEATDADEGAYGQVIYQLQADGEDEELFSVSTTGGKAVVKLLGDLDYERQTVHQLRILAVDRAKQGRVNTGTAALLIKVEDVEDQPPEFLRVNPLARVSENSPIGTQVLQVTAVDGDRGVNNAIKYDLSSNSLENIEDLFVIERDTGSVLTANLLDREALGSGTFILQITATEVGSQVLPPLSAITEVTVVVTDINDETPKFRSSHYECEIAENTPINTPVTFLIGSVPEVFDRDQGNNGTFRLYIKGAGDVFEITPTRVINEATFMIRVKNSSLIDYEKVKSFNFTLIAKEIVKQGPKFSEVPVVVHVLDRNDNYPEFVKHSYDVTVPENCEVGATVAWVQAFDNDSGVFGSAGVRYTNLAGSIEHMLDMDPKTGVISVKTAGGSNWDREQLSRHYLTVEARDDLGNGNRNTVQLIINIADVNDNPPIFTQKSYEARLLENRQDFEVPLKAEARDADLNGTKNSEIEYSLFGDFQDNFTIDSYTGLIRPKYPIDFELLGSSKESIIGLFLTVRARDWGNPSLFTDAPLTVYVQDINDNPPEFEQSFYEKSIPEDLPEGTSILKTIAMDADGSYPNNHIVYRIQSGASDKFIIGAETGIVSVARGASLDPDLTQPKRNHYSLTVLALDGAAGESQLQASVTVNITILDVNNKNPILTEPGVIETHENTIVGSTVTTLSAKDFDESAELVYKIDPLLCQAVTERGVVLKSEDYDCLEIFELDEKTGELTIAKLLDRETVETFRIGIMVEDVASETGPQFDNAVLIIQINDINDNSPKFRQPYYKFTVAENSKNGALIGNVVADDADKNKTISYTLEGRFELTSLMHLDGNTGDIVVASKIDREIYEWLNLTVKATDSGQPPLSTLAPLFIYVLDENDNAPVFLSHPSSLLIPEDTPPGTQVAVVSARDMDAGENGHITYLLDREGAGGRFSLEGDTGVLKVEEKLDREETGSYLLVVEAWDNYQYGFKSGESRNAFKHINVTILDVNDNPPQLLVPPYCINITEFHEPGQAITTVHASDADDPKTSNGQVIIDIADGNPSGLFSLMQINDWSAELTATSPLRGRHGNYTLLMRAQDLGSPSHLVEEPLTICVTDFNDHAPIFVSPPHNSTLKVPENATIGSALVQIIATDEDYGPNGAIRYRLKSDPAGDWKTFNLQPVSGILELRLPLDRVKQKIYDIRIEAYDLGVPTPLSSDLDLTVYVSNINDYRPQFLIDEFQVNFTENAKPGLELLRLPDTVDRDELEFEGPPSPICYFIVGGNELGLFNLDAFKHTLSVSRALDREEQDHYLLLVKATEDCATVPSKESFFDSSDDTQLKVIVNVSDVNDNPPRFIHRVFTGGVSTATAFGTTFMTIKAEDADIGRNAKISYYLVGEIQMTLTEGLENLRRSPFIVVRDTGEVQLNFDPQQGMKGYFDFMVLANDTGRLKDTARVFIYLLREDQRVRFVLRQHAPDLRNRIEDFRQILGNVTGAIVNIDEFRVHANHDGSVDKTRTDLYLHLVDRQDNSILEVDEVLRLVDQNTEKLDDLFKEFNVLDTQPGGSIALKSIQSANTTFWLTASSLFLLLLLFLCLALCINQRQTYQRKLKAATATAYVSPESEIEGRGLTGIARVPNTNKHSMEGSNPIWLQAYENEWYKTADDYSQNSEHDDSLDENAVTFNDDSTTQRNNLNQANCERVQNVYQTLPPVPPPRKLETTEL